MTAAAAAGGLPGQLHFPTGHRSKWEVRGSPWASCFGLLSPFLMTVCLLSPEVRAWNPAGAHRTVFEGA